MLRAKPAYVFFVVSGALVVACNAQGPVTTQSGGAGGAGGVGGTAAMGGAGGDAASGGSGGLMFGGMGGSCTTLQCKQVECGGGATTAVTGTIFDPSGTLPLYNVAVYVPAAPVDPIPDGLSCDTCDALFSGSPLVSAITDTHGKFVLQNVPVGDDIPLVIQVGKWRRVITLPPVTQCIENKVDDPQLMRLPKNMQEGNIPRIALSTGNSDPFFCLLRRLGLDDMEYGISGTDARVHFYQGANGSSSYDGGFGSGPGASFPQAPTTLWADGWQNYDMVLLSCEGSELPQYKDGHRTALRDYINAGGKVFGTHYHYNWFQDDAPADLQSIAQFTSVLTSFDGLVTIDQTFPKGNALAQWMSFVSGQSPPGQFMVYEGRQHTLSVDFNAARVWVRYQNTPEYFSFNAPIGAPEDSQCGRMVHTDIHVSSGAGNPSSPFPSACSNSPLSEQEKALIFMLFDLSGCVIPDNQTPCPPGQDNCGDPNDPPCNGICQMGCCVPPPS